MFVRYGRRMPTIRLLGTGDEDVLAALARDDADFDVDGRGARRTPLPDAAAAEYLADPDVLHWVAETDGVVVGHLLCHVQRRRSGDEWQLLLYEIGVRTAYRRRGIGRTLVAAMTDWMRLHHVREAWVLADNEDAVAFYAACGFARDEPRPTQMSRRV
jgi:ribosomal protein S18 acetylase RimI-like enzyme